MLDVRKLLAQRPLLFDGGMGTYYKAKPGQECEQANLTDPEGILAVHRAYLAAGADAIKTNTFSLPRLAAAQQPGWEQLADAGWQLAAKAAGETGAAVFADLGPAPDTENLPAEQVYLAVAKRFALLGARNFLAETNLEDVLESVNELKPDVLIVDSIQTLYNGDLTTAPGSVGQVKDCTMALMQLAKGQGITVFVIGHVNKEGSIAGPKVLEHMVDCVLYFEGEQQNSYRILRAAKNRFGATNEIGVFEMEDSGLSEVPNPSEMLLSGRPQDTPGTCVTCVMEGVRPVLAEVQALLAPTSFNVPRRTANGFDFNRANLLLAVLEKRGGLMVSSCDAYINVIGGLFLDEPAADLAMIVALASSFRDKPVSGDLAAIGEVGLTGELRSVNALGQRLSEVRRLGFTKCLIPARTGGKLDTPDGLQLIPVRNIREALAALL